MKTFPIKPDAAGADAFIKRWRESGGAERSNAQSFISELCDLLGVARPEPARQETALNDYVFERGVTFKLPDGGTSWGSIDCYKRDCFVLEAKQSGKRSRLAASTDAETLDFFGEDHGKVKAGTARRGARGWDVAMLNARAQAEDYAKALPKEHGWPPFIVIVDVAHCIELYADFSRQGKNYAQFPDPKSFRIMLEDLPDETIRARLKLLWTDPAALDPARRSAEVTRDVAERLAKIARSLETKHPPETVALFLMRCLFTMFAEDVELLPKESFTRLLDDIRMQPQSFPPMMESLWRSMDSGGWDSGIRAHVRRFNGQLFAECRALPLDGDQMNELFVAAKRDWRDVEPAIFGTLLERALNPADRRKLGAHYTPRAYVERLVVPTIIEPLTADWRDVQAIVTKHMDADEREKAVKAVRDFHAKLCSTRVLDPACGTGNFLYVAMELMKRLEGEVLDFLGRLDPEAMFLEMKGATVDPHQFLGLEINPRAVAIAELVLWLGFLKWQLRSGIEIAEPVLKKFDPPNIREQDAILAYDDKVLRRDERGKLVTRWDGKTMKKHPVTGEDVPDEEAQIEIYDYVNPRPAKWPESEFIVSNPPFSGARTIRQTNNDGYLDHVRSVHSDVPANADFVFFWWNTASNKLVSGKVRRFGLITTNSFRQSFSYALISRLLEKNISLTFAIADHPWVDESDGAAVRIAMTVCRNGIHTGTLATVVDEKPGEHGEADVVLETRIGSIAANLRLDANPNEATLLKSNDELCSVGYQITGAGFIVSKKDTSQFSNSDNLLIHKLLSARDITQDSRDLFAIDASLLDHNELVRNHPAIFQWLSDRVLPHRALNTEEARREAWWVYARPRFDFRPALSGLDSLIVTPLTSKHRMFLFEAADTICDSTTVIIASQDPFLLATLSSRIHVTWALAAGGRLGVGNDPRYNKTVCFDPFPFPDPSSALKEKLRALGERLDSFRKERQAAHPDLTMTAMYNVLERLREHDPSRRRASGAPPPSPSATPPPQAGEERARPAPLTQKEKRIHEQGLVSTLKQIHDEIDAAMFEAYGWPADLTDEEILERLVALNQTRAEEERQGKIRWLRPDFQAPKQKAAGKPRQIEAELPAGTKEKKPAAKPSFPATDGAQQIRDVRAILAAADRPLSAADIASRFRKTKDVEGRVGAVLDIFVDIGQARAEDGRYYLA